MTILFNMKWIKNPKIERKHFNADVSLCIGRWGMIEWQWKVNSNIKQSCNSFGFGLILYCFICFGNNQSSIVLLESVLLSHIIFHSSVLVIVQNKGFQYLEWMGGRGVLIPSHSLVYILVIMTQKKREDGCPNTSKRVDIFGEKGMWWVIFKNLDFTSGNPVRELSLCRKCCPESVFHFTSLCLWFCVDSILKVKNVFMLSMVSVPP